MDKLLQLNVQTAGRDKLARLLQYIARAIRIKLQESNRSGSQSFKNLEARLSSFRKLLRFGKCIDTAYSILSILNHQDKTVKVTVILGKIFNSIFLLADHMLWLDKVNLYPVDSNKWGKISTHYGLYRLYMNLLRDFYEILKILRMHKDDIIPTKKGIYCPFHIFRIITGIAACMRRYPQVTIDIIKNICDILVPLTALGYLNLSPYTVSVFGVISSYAGLIVLLNPACRLSPA